MHYKCVSISQVGPSFYEKWFHWQSCSPEQATKAAIRTELERLIAAEPDHKAKLSYEEITTVRAKHFLPCLFSRSPLMALGFMGHLLPNFKGRAFETQSRSTPTVFRLSGEAEPSDERVRGGQRPHPGNLASRLPPKLPHEGLVPVPRLPEGLLHLQPGHRV